MKLLSDRINRIKSKKIRSLFNESKPIEYLLMCLPFVLSFTYTRQIGIKIFGFVIIGLAVILGLGFLFLIGLNWRFISFILITFLSLFLVFYLGKPWEYWPLADRDDAIRVAIEAILTGQNPYKATTQFGNHPTPLPFTFLLYLPIYLISGGYVFYMNIVIMTVFCLVILYKFIDTKKAYLITPIISFITFSDFFFLETVMNSDVINISLILCMLILLLPEKNPTQRVWFNRFHFYPHNPMKIDKKVILFAVLMGCLLATRIYLWLISLLIFVYILKVYGLKRTFYLSLISLSVFLSIILPFAMQDLQYFVFSNPLAHNAGKFSVWRSYDTIDPIGYIILDILNNVLIFGNANGILITLIIIFISLIFSLIKCHNLFHFMIIASLCFFIFLFFYFFGSYYIILRDYVSIAAVPFIFSFFFTNFENRAIQHNSGDNKKGATND